MMDDNRQLALRIDGALQAAGQEVTALRAELAATGRRLAELGSEPPMEHGPQGGQRFSFLFLCFFSLFSFASPRAGSRLSAPYALPARFLLAFLSLPQPVS